MDTRKRFRKNIILILMMAIVIFFASCIKEPPQIGFRIESQINEGIYFEYYCRNSPHGYYVSDISPEIYASDIHGDLKRKVKDVSWDEAMQLLENNVDSIIIFRVSDMEYVFYSQRENAPEQEKYFFDQESWVIKNEIYTEKGLSSRDYVFVVTDELFE